MPEPPPPSSAVTRIQQALDLDHCIKLEPDKARSHNILDRYQQVTQQWIQANTDPQTGRGRYVFRKGCHQYCITTLLHGIGTDRFPQNRQADNEFIRHGHLWVSGNEAWNPYGPPYPGAPGLVAASILKYLQPDQFKAEAQTEFHMFVECSKDPLAKLWQGRRAAGGRHVSVHLCVCVCVAYLSW